MLENYEKVLTLKCFSHKDAMQLFGDARRTSNILYAMKKKGLIQSVRRDFYAVVSLETKIPMADPFEIASGITGNSCISHHSAFEFHGAADRISSDVWVSSGNSFREFEFAGSQYHCLAMQNDFGILSQGMVRVTDLERTVLDGIKDMDKAGGLQELLCCLGRIPRIREEVLAEYLKQYQNRFLFQKVGYLLRHFPQMGLTEIFFDYCGRNKGQSSRYLCDGPEKGGYVFSKEWNLCAPKKLHRLLEEGGEEDDD